LIQHIVAAAGRADKQIDQQDITRTKEKPSSRYGISDSFYEF